MSKIRSLEENPSLLNYIEVFQLTADYNYQVVPGQLMTSLKGLSILIDQNK